VTVKKNIHVVAPTLWEKLEDLAELERIRAVVDLHEERERCMSKMQR
jgi:hypothetical protein